MQNGRGAVRSIRFDNIKRKVLHLFRQLITIFIRIIMRVIIGNIPQLNMINVECTGLHILVNLQCAVEFSVRIGYIIFPVI